VADFRSAGYEILGALSGPWSRVTDGDGVLRVLAYHAVDEKDAFDIQISHIAHHYQPIGADEVMSGGWPARAVWVTLDDGDPSIIDIGLEILTRYSIPATAFICPGVIDTDQPFWWHLVVAAAEAGVQIDGTTLSSTTVDRLKLVPDASRRQYVARVGEAYVERVGTPFTRRQLTRREIDIWVGTGNTIGNHTWDHPLLDQCATEVQSAQVERAHQWITEHYETPTLFAYPNGNLAPETAELLAELGYGVGALFDHRLHRGGDPLLVSRIRANASDSLAEFKAKVSGLHPTLTRARFR
jgi:peptidoglycan/xylan/chitin deacetylase (PgdA/CDA1 family)